MPNTYLVGQIKETDYRTRSNPSALAANSQELNGNIIIASFPVARQQKNTENANDNKHEAGRKLHSR